MSITGGINFSGIANLTGGSHSDTLTYVNTAPLVTGTITELGGSLALNAANTAVGQSLSFSGPINTNGGNLSINSAAYLNSSSQVHSGSFVVTFTSNVTTSGGNVTVFADSIALTTTSGPVSISTVNATGSSGQYFLHGLDHHSRQCQRFEGDRQSAGTGRRRQRGFDYPDSQLLRGGRHGQRLHISASAQG